MATLKTVWGIDIGQCALKALKLREVDGQLQAEAFDIIEYPKILSQPDADRPQLIRNALEQFLAQNDVSNALVAISVPGQSSFTRFVKLPPVEPKKIPSIVKFEAEQQIPFDINEVIWRWQSLNDPDSPDVEVGLFAMKRSDVHSVLDHFTEVGVGVDVVQMAPLALFNFMTYDQQVAPDGGTLLVDIGAESTNLVVADGPRLWTRTIQLGGNNFTEALVKAFKLSFSKAEKLKRTAATSKYARQIFQAMRPVFADLVQEIQRSIGFYTSLHRETRFKRLLGLGNGFRLPGLQKFLEQNLNISVVRIDGYNALQPSPTISAPTFTENVLSFAVAYGLALQGLELTRIDTNLLPDEIASKRRWVKKRPWFAAAGVLLVATVGGLVSRPIMENGTLASSTDDLRSAQQMVEKYSGLASEFRSVANEGETEKLNAEKLLRLQGYRSFWPDFLEVINKSIRATASHQAFMTADKDNVETLKRQPDAGRQCIVVTELTATYVPDLKAAGATNLAGTNAGSSSSGLPANYPMYIPSPSGMSMAAAASSIASGERGFKVVMAGRCPMPRDGTTNMINSLLATSIEMAKKLYGNELEIQKAEIISFSVPGADSSGRVPQGMVPPSMPMYPGMRPVTGLPAPVAPVGPVDPLTGQLLSTQTTFQIGWIVRIKSDGLPVPAKPNSGMGSSGW